MSFAMSKIILGNKRSHREKFPAGAFIVDVTSRAAEPWRRFSPFYPHGDIPIPFTPNQTAMSVEGIWQGLKVFEREGIDVTKFEVTNMRGIKRSSSSLGTTKGHQRGLNSTELISYLDARVLIYIPTYRWVLEHRLQPQILELKKALGNR
jgi:hypothetical protein